MNQTVLSDYLSEIARIHATRAGTGEISYYSALTGALNATGQKLKPRVFCVSNLRNTGAGFPDMGLFAGTVAHAPDAWSTGRPPERGVVEVDDIPADLSLKQNSAQVARYKATQNRAATLRPSVPLLRGSAWRHLPSRPSRGTLRAREPHERRPR